MFTSRRCSSSSSCSSAASSEGSATRQPQHPRNHRQRTEHPHRPRNPRANSPTSSARPKWRPGYSAYDGITQARSLDERLNNLGFMRDGAEQFDGPDLALCRLRQWRFLSWSAASCSELKANSSTPRRTDRLHRAEHRTAGTVRHAAASSFFDAELATLRSDDRPDYADSLRSAHPRLVQGDAGVPAGQIKTRALSVLHQPESRHDHRQPGQPAAMPWSAPTSCSKRSTARWQGRR